MFCVARRILLLSKAGLVVAKEVVKFYIKKFLGLLVVTNHCLTMLIKFPLKISLDSKILLDVNPE